MKPKLWPVSGREVPQHPPESLNFSSSKIISFWRIGNLSQSAACLQQVAGRQDRGARHLLGAIIYRLPSGHLDDLQKWGFIPADWSMKFVQYVALRNPQKSFCTSVHLQVYGSQSPVSSSDAAASVKEETSRPVTPDGQADFSEPSISSEILRKLQQPGSALKAVLQEFNKDTREEHRSCLGAFGRLQSSYDDSPWSANLRQWAAVVARYSFRPWPRYMSWLAICAKTI